MKNYIAAGILPFLLIACNAKDTDSGYESEDTAIEEALDTGEEVPDTGAEASDSGIQDSEKPSTVPDFVDMDDDGFSVSEGDCNDRDPTVYPGAPEVVFDGIDQDCDGEDSRDSDNDGWNDNEDCDDGNSAVHPGAEEVNDGVDNDCDNIVDEGFPGESPEDGPGDVFWPI
jgi:hypothetical protein